MKGSHPWFY